MTQIRAVGPAAPASSAPPSNPAHAHRLIALYRTMARIRAFEDAAEIASQGGVQAWGLKTSAKPALVRGPLHLSTGQEAVAAGVCANLTREDLLTSTHRGHGHTLAKGADVNRMMAELFGKATGTNHGKGGSMHIADFSVGMLGANGVVAAGMPIAVGAAHALKIRGRPEIVACFFGDGAVNRGPFLEALNWAVVYKLPVLFVCEDNRISATTPTGPMTGGPGASARAESIGVPAVVVDGNDVEAVDAAAARLIGEIRAHEGPASAARRHVPVQRARVRGSRRVPRRRGSRAGPGVRSADARARQTARARRRGGRHRRDRRRGQGRDRRRAGAGRRRAAARPCHRVHGHPEHGSRRMAVMNYSQAAATALAEAMRADPNVVALGEDLGRGGIFAQYRGLQQEFGPERVIDTPISEATIMGAAVGMALAGLRPVVEMRVVDFALCAMDELINQAAKNRYMFGGQGRVPLVVRMPIGLWTASAAQHSQSLEAWFAHIPGLTVVVPSMPADNYGLLMSALESGDPVVYLEHKELWGQEGEVEPGTRVPLGVARVVREGDDVTIVSWSNAMPICIDAAAELDRAGISAEVIDLRTIWPWDRATVLGSAARTGALLVVHEAVQVGGFGAEIAAAAAEATGCRVKRVGAPRIPSGYSKPLEDESRVTVAQVVAAASSLVSQ